MCDVIDILDNADPCQSSMGGTEDEAYYALLSDFASIPDVPVGQSTLAAKFTIASAPTFKQGKCWKKLQLLGGTGVLNYETVGTAGAKSPNFQFSIAGNNPQGQVLNNIADNRTPYVFLVKRNSLPADRYDLIGSFEHKAKLMGSFNGGNVEGDGALYNFEVKAVQKFEVHYTSTIQLTPQA